MFYHFPTDFLWGTATAPHQVEGGLDELNDYGVMSSPGLLKNDPLVGEFVEPAGRACNQYELYDEDIARMAARGIRAYRFGIEMARVMPEPNEINWVEVEHYRKVLESCRRHGIIPTPTLHHFTSPIWLISQGGWESSFTPKYMAAFARLCAEQYGSLIVGRTADEKPGYIWTMNEINTGRLNADGVAPNEVRRERPWVKEAARRMGVDPAHFTPWQFASSDSAVHVIMESHFAMVHAIKSVRPDLRVGLTIASQSLEPASNAPEDIHATASARWFREDQFLSILKDHPMRGDVVGVQAYTHLRIASAQSFAGMKRPDAGYRVLDPQEHDRKVAMGYGFAPQALADCLRHTHEMTGMDLVATEFGVGTEDDAERVEFYQAALAGLAEVVLDGVPVLGAFAWSDLDNWEWEGGFQYRFGLNYVNYETQTRDPRYSAFMFGQIAADQTLVVPNPVYYSQWGPGHGSEIVSTAPEAPILLPNAWSLHAQKAS